MDDVSSFEVGSIIGVDIFTEGELVDVVGTSKGKGFAGVVKHHNYSRGSMGHGSKYHRGSGSLGAMGPARVFKGRKLPGRMGRETVTLQSLTVVKVFPEKNILLIKDAFPGAGPATAARGMDAIFYLVGVIHMGGPRNAAHFAIIARPLVRVLHQQRDGRTALTSPVKLFY